MRSEFQMIMIKIENSCKEEKIFRPNSKETIDYLEEEQQNEKTELGNLEKVNKIKEINDRTLEEDQERQRAKNPRDTKNTANQEQLRVAPQRYQKMITQ